MYFQSFMLRFFPPHSVQQSGQIQTMKNHFSGIEEATADRGESNSRAKPATNIQHSGKLCFIPFPTHLHSTDLISPERIKTNLQSESTHRLEQNAVSQKTACAALCVYLTGDPHQDAGRG